MLPDVSVIIIGRNEANNLPDCIRSFRKMNYPQNKLEVIYVDTNSSDGSPQLARTLGVTVFEENSNFPSPARARNRGLKAAKYDIVHFVDGDMTVDPNYLLNAVKHLNRDKVACVFGKLIERNAQVNFISRILQYPWLARSSGFVDAPGAGGTFIKAVLKEVGGYDPNVLSGEETELGFRMRFADYRILLIDQTMAIHDYDIRTFAALWKRYFNIGRSFDKILQLPYSHSLVSDKKAARRVLYQGILILALLIVISVLNIWRLVFLCPFLLSLYVIVRYWRPSKLRKIRICYFMIEYLFKPAILFGMLQFYCSSGRSC